MWVSNAQSVYHSSVATVTTNSQDDWHTVHCYSHVKNPRPNSLGEIPYRPTPIPLGWLTTQVSGDRAWSLKQKAHMTFRMASAHVCILISLYLYWYGCHWVLGSCQPIYLNDITPSYEKANECCVPLHITHQNAFQAICLWKIQFF